jgi:predicted O-methyltransferase YrrM
MDFKAAINASSKIRIISQRLLRAIRTKFWQFALPPRVAKVDVSRFTTQPISDISEHLSFLYFLVNVHRPKQLLELGTRGGESTKVLETYCRENSLCGHSFDLSPAPEWLKKSPHWKHYVGDDLILGASLLENNEWPDGNTFEALDFIFLDTSHEYLHTVAELKTYIPLLSDRGMIVFHDTHLTNRPTRRLDGGVNYGWDNERGVVRAIEEYLQISIAEDSLFAVTDKDQKWFLHHIPWNNGLTVYAKMNLA